MKESIYKSYDELPLFLNADTGAKTLGVAVQRLRADARKRFPHAENRQPYRGAEGEFHLLGGAEYRRCFVK